MSRNCWEIDPNLIVSEKEPMRVGRYNAPLALVRDKYLFVLGGMLGKNKSTELCEV